MMDFDLSKSMYDYQDTLAAVCRKVAPMRILEWGPGYSTELMRKLCPEAEIVSIEHSAKWHKAIEGQVPHSQVLFVPIKGLDTDEYPAYPLKHKLGKFDLIFVDGISRNACLITAAQVLRRGGAIVLHNAKSEKYRPALNILETLGFKARGSRTRVFRREAPLKLKELTVVTWLYSPIREGHRDYQVEHVERMFRMFHRYYAGPFKLVCFTDRPEEFPPWIDARPLPVDIKGTFKRLWVFSREFAEMFPGARVFSVDLDVVFVNDLTNYLYRDESLVLMKDPMIEGATYKYSPTCLVDAGAHADVWDNLDVKAMKSWYSDNGHKKVGNDMAWLSYYFRDRDMPTFVQHRARLIGNEVPEDAHIVHFSGKYKPWNRGIEKKYPWLKDYM